MIITKRELVQLLSASGDDQENLFRQARAARDSRIGALTVRGVIEVTNSCRVDCTYCPMRTSNRDLKPRYLLSDDSILEQASLIHAAGIDVVLLQGGETRAALATVRRVLQQIRKMFDDRVELIVNLGTLDADDYRTLKELGADRYIIKFETSDPGLHLHHRGETLDQRRQSIGAVIDSRLSLGTGSIVGLPGQAVEAIADDLMYAAALSPEMCSVSPFMPAPGTPLAGEPPGSVDLTLNALAALRLLLPSADIPSVSALEQSARGSQVRGLMAGANVMTVNFSPPAKRADYLIYGKERFIVGLDHVRASAALAGLVVGGSRTP